MSNLTEQEILWIQLADAMEEDRLMREPAPSYHPDKMASLQGEIYIPGWHGIAFKVEGDL